MKTRSSFALIVPLVLVTAAAGPVVGRTAPAPARAPLAEGSALRLSDIRAIQAAPVEMVDAQMPACKGCHGPTLPPAVH